MNTRQTVPLSTYRDVIKGTFSLSPVAFLGWSVPMWLLCIRCHLFLSPLSLL